MNGIFDLLDRKDRRILGALCLFLLLALIFLFVVALGEKRSHFNSLDRLALKKESAKEIEKARLNKNDEWLKWQKTLDDMKELRTKYFYKEEEGIAPLVRDTQQIINGARIRVSQKRYDYAEIKEDMYRIVRITFETTGSYTDLKKFIHSVETFPRFLVVQKIDFLEVDPFSGGLKVQIALAGYYEQEK
jgi:Tfp pilus assembly protein PilO